MDLYIELLYPCVSSQLWQFQTSFPPQLNRQKFWFIISPDRIIINPTFTAFHSNFMVCRDCDSFGHKFSPQILLFFTTVVSLQTFLFIPSLALFFVSCSLSLSLLCLLISGAQVWFVSLFCVWVFMESVNVCPVCVCATQIRGTKMSKSASELLTLAQMHCFSTTMSVKVIHAISCLGEGWEKDKETENDWLWAQKGGKEEVVSHPAESLFIIFLPPSYHFPDSLSTFFLLPSFFTSISLPIFFITHLLLVSSSLLLLSSFPSLCLHFPFSGRLLSNVFQA